MYDSLDAAKKFEPKYRLIRVSFFTADLILNFSDSIKGQRAMLTGLAEDWHHRQ